MRQQLVQYSAYLPNRNIKNRQQSSLVLRRSILQMIKTPSDLVARSACYKLILIDPSKYITFAFMILKVCRFYWKWKCITGWDKISERHKKIHYIFLICSLMVLQDFSSEALNKLYQWLLKLNPFLQKFSNSNS